METARQLSQHFAGLDQDLDLAEMEIASGRLGEARLRFAKMTRLQRETPRALLLRARATETLDSRRMLASFVRTAIDRFSDPRSRAQLAAALAYCGDRTAAMETLPPEGGLTTADLAYRKEALEALGTVPDLVEAPEPLVTAMIGRRFASDRRR